MKSELKVEKKVYKRDSCLTAMSWGGLIIFGVKIKHPLQILGTSLVLFSFFVIFDWSSNYLNLVNASGALINNSEDALSWDFWAWLFHPETSPFRRWVTWILAFPVTVFFATLIGVLLNNRKPRLNA